MRYILLLIFCLGLMGCKSAAETQATSEDTNAIVPEVLPHQPPLYGRGDVVSPKGSPKIGIITQVIDASRSDSKPSYDVIFEFSTWRYEEDQLVLRKHFDWNERFDVDAEVFHDKEIEAIK